MRGNFKSDSGSYVNGVYTTKNGNTSIGGLACPKGTRLYDMEHPCPIFFNPEGTPPEEDFRMITPEVAPDVLPYYAISNYGRVMNVNSGQIMKPNYRSGGYEYYCLAADNCKNGQKKYSTNRLVLKTFDPVENMDELQVNHLNKNKSDNYINKRMPDGSIQSNLEWSTPSENCIHRSKTDFQIGKLSFEEAAHIRELHAKGFSYMQIVNMFYPHVSYGTVQNVCLNKVYKDPNYTPVDYSKIKDLNPTNIHKLSMKDCKVIRKMYDLGMNAKEIQKEYFSQFSYSTILDVVNKISHNENIS